MLTHILPDKAHVSNICESPMFLTRMHRAVLARDVARIIALCKDSATWSGELPMGLLAAAHDRRTPLHIAALRCPPHGQKTTLAATLLTVACVMLTSVWLRYHGKYAIAAITSKELRSPLPATRATSPLLMSCWSGARTPTAASSVRGCYCHYEDETDQRARLVTIQCVVPLLVLFAMQTCLMCDSSLCCAPPQLLTRL